MLAMIWFCGVLFFKQKTAYEMRISDWSSDVCSSDLTSRHWSLRSDQCREVRDLLGLQGEKLVAGLRRLQRSGRRLAGADDVRHGGARAEIGRASCRERVCQYG